MRYILWSLLIIYSFSAVYTLIHLIKFEVLLELKKDFKKDYKHYKIATFFGLIFYLIISPYWVYLMISYILKRKKKVS